MAIHFTCPSCQTAYLINDRCAGITLPCKTCREDLLVPEARPVEASTLATQPISISPASAILPQPTAVRPERTTRPSRRRSKTLLFGVFGGIAAAIVMCCLSQMLIGFFWDNSSDDTAPGVNFSGSGPANAFLDDGISYSGDQVTAIGRVDALTPANDGIDYMVEMSLATADPADPHRQKALNMSVDYVVGVRVDRHTVVLFRMPKIKGSEFQPLCDRLVGKRVRGKGTVMFSGDPLIVTKSHISVLD